MTVRRKARYREDGAPLDLLQVLSEDVGRALSDCESGNRGTAAHGRKEVAAYFVVDVESGTLSPVGVLAVVADMLDGALSVDYRRHSNRENPISHALGFTGSRRFPAVQVEARKLAARDFVRDVRAGRTPPGATRRVVARSLDGLLSVNFQKRANWRHQVAKAMGISGEPNGAGERSLVELCALFGQSIAGAARTLARKTGGDPDNARKTIRRARRRLHGKRSD